MSGNIKMETHVMPFSSSCTDRGYSRIYAFSFLFFPPQIVVPCQFSITFVMIRNKGIKESIRKMLRQFTALVYYDLQQKKLEY